MLIEKNLKIFMTIHYNSTDRLVNFIDTGLRTIFGKPITTNRANPAVKITSIKNNKLNNKSNNLSANLMRVNHCGEVCAQALYQGQAMTARNKSVQFKLKQAAIEENDHLEWCSTRLKELNSHTSYLNPLWYTGSLCIGLLAGLVGDKWSLGFLAETEHQVTAHLQSHLSKLPLEDQTSRVIIEQMIIDEQQHATTAIDNGAYELPGIIKFTMSFTAKIMTNVAYYI